MTNRTPNTRVIEQDGVASAILEDCQAKAIERAERHHVEDPSEIQPLFSSVTEGSLPCFLILSVFLMLVVSGCVSTSPNQIISLSPNDHARTDDWVDQIERAESCSWSVLTIFRFGDASYDTLFKEIAPSRSNRRLSYVLVDKRTTNYLIASKDCMLLTAHYIATGEAADGPAVRVNEPQEEQPEVAKATEEVGVQAREAGEVAVKTVEERAASSGPTTKEDEPETVTKRPEPSGSSPKPSTATERLEFKTKSQTVASISEMESWVGSDIRVKPKGKREVLRGKLVRVVKLDAHLVLEDGKKTIVNLTRVDWIERVVSKQGGAQ